MSGPCAGKRTIRGATENTDHRSRLLRARCGHPCRDAREGRDKIPPASFDHLVGSRRAGVRSGKCYHPLDGAGRGQLHRTRRRSHHQPSVCLRWRVQGSAARCNLARRIATAHQAVACLNGECPDLARCGRAGIHAIRSVVEGEPVAPGAWSDGLRMTHLRHRPASILQPRSQFRHQSGHSLSLYHAVS